MGSTFGGLNTVLRGLNVQQVSLDTVGHNIANASTDGYSRQATNLGTTNSLAVFGKYGTYQVGTGVEVESITRARDVFVDKQMWQEGSTLNYANSAQQKLSNIEGIFNDTSGTGIQTVLNQFWNSWQTLATNASNEAARTQVRERGTELVQAIGLASDQLQSMVTDINSTIEIDVKTVNQITSEIASLNKQISLVEAGGIDHANDLRDKRDLLVDQLSKYVDVRVVEDSEHNYVIQTASTTLVDGQRSHELGTMQLTDPDYGYPVTTVYMKDTNQIMNFSNGEIKALVDSRDSTTGGVKCFLNNLSTISQFLLQDFNDVHKTGYGTDNSTGTNFFGANGTDYSSATYTKGDWLQELQVNPQLFASGGLALIAAKTSAVNSIAVTQTNNAGSVGSITGTSGAYTNGNIATLVRVDVTATGAGTIPSQITYYTSTDGGTTWGTGTTLNETTPGSGQFAFTGGIQGVTFTLDLSSTTNPSGTAAANTTSDKYYFSVSQGNIASGDNAVLLSNRLKVDQLPILDNRSLDSYYASMISVLGSQSQNLKRLADNQQSLVDQITTWRESVSGVNMDEEMTNMIRFQKGYNAAARVLTTMDDMLDTLINGTGRVGR